MVWETIDSAPKDGKPFLAWYESKFGPPYGTMKWEPEPEPKPKIGRTLSPSKNGRFHSMTMGTQTKFATYWMKPEGPRIWDTKTPPENV